ncbi:diguanylate cyclase domain-containing protein [Shimia biformata]|uniref:diguanylate cyclase domain-containing protein n=1 Tax=Shimia biformata TaxID=1294299 RepID=UPI0019523797|nr:diguanylate cyclase [Shimia biformata]
MPGKILIVDSTATNRIVLKVKLTGAFYQVVQAASPEEALDALKSSPPDLVLLGDGGSKEAMEGLCRHLKNDPKLAVTPIIVVSATPTPRLRLAALRAGADDVLDAPVDDQFLLARIRGLLRSRDSMEEMRMKGGTAQFFGLAEAQQEFAGSANVLISGGDAGSALRWRALLKPLVPYTVRSQRIGETMMSLSKSAAPDAVIIVPGPGDGDDGLRLLAELRAHKDTRRAAILVVGQTPNRDVLVDALDLGADDVMPAGFDPEEVAQRLEALLQRKRLTDRLLRDVQSGLTAAIVDPLTGLFNRRYAMPRLSAMADLAATAGGEDCAVMVADLDHFKSINDRFGHSAGDDVLIEVARRLRSVLGPRDLIARIGGEEFLIALPTATKSRAQDVARHLCQRVGQTPVVLARQDISIPVTISIGVAMGSELAENFAYCDGSQLAASILDRADRALYGAKSHGRNRVTMSLPVA